MASRQDEIDPFSALALPSIIAPAALIGLGVYFLDQRHDLHAVVNILIFLVTCGLFYKFIPHSILFGVSHVLVTLALLFLIYIFAEDALWALFWSASYFAVGTYSLVRVLREGGGRDQIIDAERSDDPESAPRRTVRSRPKRTTVISAKVGSCKGWNGESSNTRTTHPLYRCGHCGMAGCQDRGCEKVNFDGTKCTTCGNNANFAM